MGTSKSNNPKSKFVQKNGLQIQIQHRKIQRIKKG